MSTTAAPCRVAERRPRPRTAVEKAICGLGNVGEDFIKGAAAAAVTRLGAELADIAALEASHGREALVAALARAVSFGRFRSGDVRSILAAGHAVPRPARPADAPGGLPKVPVRRLAEYAPGWGVSTTAPPLPADLEAGLRRLKLATFRRNAPELLQSPRPNAGTRSPPAGPGRAEVAARDASMAAARLKAAGFPVKKSFEDFDFSASSIPRATLDYLASLE